MLWEEEVNEMFEKGLAIGLVIGGIVGFWVAALCAAAKKTNPCHDCEIYYEPDSDHRHCFDCTKGAKNNAETLEKKV